MERCLRHHEEEEVIRGAHADTAAGTGEVTGMTHDQAFLLAVAENPADPASRLIYADWLDEQGDPAAADLRRGDGALKVWPDGTVFWRLEALARTWLLGKLAVPESPCPRCQRRDGGWEWQQGAWQCQICHKS
jgi:uncharacterized protein (TIGR02996 family)